MIGYLRKNFPVAINSETVKKFKLAPNNESYVINALHFIGVIDEDGKRTSEGQDVFVANDTEFPKKFAELLKNSYVDLFGLRGDDAWNMSKTDLISYFRVTDKTSEAIGERQAGVFVMFRKLAGYEIEPSKRSVTATLKPKNGKPKAVPAAKPQTSSGGSERHSDSQNSTKLSVSEDSRRDMALTVRIEINLPANGTQETYDAIFKSIRANLINE